MKYKEIEKTKQDKAQLKLTNIEKKVEVKPQVITDFDTIVFCVFCLHKDKLYNFKIVSKKDYKVKCSDCGRTFLMVTLKGMCRMTKKRIEAYAKWVYNNRRRFWNKVNNPVWSNRLKEYGWSGTFWSTYKKIKAELKRLEYVEGIEDEDYEYTREERLKALQRYSEGQK